MRSRTPALLAASVALALAGASAQAQSTTGSLTVAPVQATGTGGSTATVGTTSTATTTTGTTPATTTTRASGAAAAPTGTADIRPPHRQGGLPTGTPTIIQTPPSDAPDGDGDAGDGSGDGDGDADGNGQGDEALTLLEAQRRAAEISEETRALTATPPSRVASGLPAPGSTAGTSIFGTSSGDAFTGESRNPETGQTAGTSIAGTSTGDAFTGISRGDVATAIQAPVTPLAETSPVVIPGGAAVIATEAARIATPPIVVNQNVITNGSNDATGTPVLDRAVVREAQRRAATPPNAQRLFSIAPRTDVDRSHEVPDDPLSPALTTPDRPLITR